MVFSEQKKQSPNLNIKTWETVKDGNSFESQEGAEMFVEKYLNELKNKKEVVIKEYNY